MNLNNDIRQAILSCIIKDIPRVHTAKLEERLQAVMDEDIAKHAPAALAAMWADKANLRGFLNTTSTHCGYLFTKDYGGDSLYIHSLNGFFVQVPSNRYCKSYQMSKSAGKKFGELVNKARGEADQIKDVESKLKAAFAAVRTVKQFKAAFPEFAKYAPKEEARSTMLPAIANVVADLTKLGWPEDAKAA